MCDLSQVRNWLIATLIAIGAAIAIIVGAAFAKGSWWSAWTSPIGMLLAAGAAGLAIILCGQALSALDTFCKCAGPRCAGPCGNLRNVLVAANVVLGIQAAACLGAALTALVPVVGDTVMWIIIGALVIQAALIISAFAFMSQLATCQLSPSPSGGAGQTPGTTPAGGAGNSTGTAPAGGASHSPGTVPEKPR
jgi:hypothetical protein